MAKDNPYLQFKKAELHQEVDRRGIKATNNADKEELATLLLESDGQNDNGEPTATVYALPEYDPTDEERKRDKLVGYQVALRAVQAQKAVSGGQPIYDETIEGLTRDINALKSELGLE